MRAPEGSILGLPLLALLLISFQHAGPSLGMHLQSVAGSQPNLGDRLHTVSISTNLKDGLTP